MGSYPRVLPGQALRLPASAFNGALDMAEAYKRAGLIGPLQQNLPASGPTTILLRNDSGVDVPQYGILGIGDPLHLWDGDDAALQAEFLRNPRAFKGLLPTAAHENRYALAMQAIPKDQIGACALRGVYPCILNVTDPTHKQASPTVGDVTKMTSDDCGFADIVWVESGTGDKHALVAVRPFTMVCATVACSDFIALDLTDISVSVSGFNLVLECYDGDYNPFNCDIANVYGATINGYTWTTPSCGANPCIQPGALGYYSGCPTCGSNQGRILITCKTDGDGTYFEAQVSCNGTYAWPPCPGATMCWPDSSALVRCASGSAQIVAGRLEFVMDVPVLWPVAQPGSEYGSVTFSGKMA